MSDDDVDTQRRYERVLRVVADQCTDEDLVGCRERQVYLTLAAHGTYNPDGIRKTLKHANGQDLVRWRDDEGRWRLTLCTDPDLTRAQRWAGERGLADAVASLNQALAEVREDE